MIYLIVFFVAVALIAVFFTISSTKIEIKKCKCVNFEKCNEENCECDENCKCYDEEGSNTCSTHVSIGSSFVNSVTKEIEDKTIKTLDTILDEPDPIKEVPKEEKKVEEKKIPVKVQKKKKKKK
jgi:hypothetical protein